MASKEAWRTLEGTELQDGVVLRELVEVHPAPLFRAESASGSTLLVRFWGKEYGNPQTIVDRHREAAFLDHPGLLRCVQSGLAASGDDQYAYGVFEGPDSLLADHIQTEPMPTPEVKALGAELADALEYLHSRDLVFCALDPWTVARKDGRWLLADYSQMRLTGEDYASETRRLLVSFPAAAPEAFEGKVTSAWDAWSLAHVLRTAFLGVGQRRGAERPQPVPELPPAFAEVLSACTVMNPAQRCTVRQIADNLQTLPPDARIPIPAAPPAQEPEHRRVDVFTPSRPPMRDDDEADVEPDRRKWLLAGVGALAVLLLLFLFTRDRTADNRVQQQTAGRISPQQQQQQPADDLPSPVDMPPATEVAAMSTRGRATAQSEIRDVVDRWANTFRTRDLGAHVSLYTPTVERFFLTRNVPVDRVRRTKQQTLQRAGDIRQYALENIQIKLQSPTRATVSFDKTYEFSRGTVPAGKVRSELELRRVNETWRIASERDVKVYWQRKS